MRKYKWARTNAQIKELILNKVYNWYFQTFDNQLIAPWNLKSWNLKFPHSSKLKPSAINCSYFIRSNLYEAILQPSSSDGKLDKRNFRKKILAMDFVVDLNESQENVAHRPARLYEFDRVKYEQFIAEGFNFEL